MATAAIMLPDSALRPPGATEPGKQDGSVRRAVVNPALAVFTDRRVEELLEIVVEHIESQLRAIEDVKSPVEVPEGIHDSHSRQIQVCLLRFKAAKVPAVSIRDYLLRLHQHCPFSTPKLLALIHYLTVLDVLYVEISKVLIRATAHRLILTAIVIASKVLDDRLMPQIRWSVVGGITLQQLHGLELAFFFLLNGKCWITEEALITAGNYLTGRIATKTMILDPMTHTPDADVIWSSVGNRSGTEGISGTSEI
ncbi:protein of unknown function [Taphrina deformans PYCC 5710]|uniref:Cyclin-domain-containing protein n=1 Tax=Taphrina deformans (strain PYCC 5710 / ATCC 11124 / CBS 356.35 / IMI 108563 / JCM 9778 / NBRC 8474) TaxID=1097556 RepID=R4XH57_TAPDE|nr:protein of unknown function [Taphrina deformans PYCC 5710]|eukprot:CCG85023.1 protein of unknown function [Taphrina deformans PYCC 5710]